MSSKVYKIISAIIGVIGFIGGIVCGKVFEIRTLKYSSSVSSAFDKYETHFNSTLMLSIWLGAILLVLIFLGISAILSNQESIMSKLNNSNQPEQTNESNIKIQKAEEIKEETVAKKLVQNIQDREPSDDEIKCPHCGKIQNKSIKRCLSCSTLIDE